MWPVFVIKTCQSYGGFCDLSVISCMIFMGGNMCYVWLRKQVPLVNVCCEHDKDVSVSTLSESVLFGMENR